MRVSRLAAALCAVLVLVGCGGERYAKIALVAPYEGRYREIGYDVIPAVRMAVREWAARPEAQRLRIELVSYDDMGDPALAEDQARKIGVDGDVRVVIGHWLPWTTAEAAPLYEGQRLIASSPTEVNAWRNLSPGRAELEAAQGAWALRTGAAAAPLSLGVVEAANSVPATVGGPLFGLDQFAALWGPETPSPDFVTGAALPRDAVIPGWSEVDLAAFEAAYIEASGGAEPGLHSLIAYLAAWLAIEEIAGADIDTPADGLRFDETGRIVNLPVSVYSWQDEGTLRLLETVPPEAVDSR